MSAEERESSEALSAGTVLGMFFNHQEARVPVKVRELAGATLCKPSLALGKTLAVLTDKMAQHLLSIIIF